MIKSLLIIENLYFALNSGQFRLPHAGVALQQRHTLGGNCPYITNLEYGQLHLWRKLPF
jgi:hypothetical protein